MKFSAIPPVLLVSFFCITGCDTEDLSPDPWEGVLGMYTGTREKFIPGEFFQAGDSLSGWSLRESTYHDTVRIASMDCRDGSEGEGICIRVQWNQAEHHMHLRDRKDGFSAYKSNREILVIPRGAIYPGSDYVLPATGSSQVVGMEFFEGNGLYLYELSGPGASNGCYRLIAFTGNKNFTLSDPRFLRAYGYSRENASKHYPRNIVP